MRFFDVWEWAGRQYQTLSGGERQRVQFARVLTQIWHPTPGVPRYLILDEPLTFLDIRHQLDFLHKLRALLSGGDLVVVGVMHDLNLAARFADQVLLIHRGRALAIGPTETVMRPELIEEAFAVRSSIHRGEAGRIHLLFE